MPEGKTNFERIVGGTEEQKRTAVDELQDLFDLKSEVLGTYELQKTAEEIETIQLAELGVDEIVKHYGGKPQALPLDHVYVLEPGSVLRLSNGKASIGIHNPVYSKIGAERSTSRLLFAGTVTHELLHIKSYKSARLYTNDKGDEADLYRTGLVMVGKDEKEYFRF